MAKLTEVHENQKPFKFDVCWLNLQKELLCDHVLSVHEGKKAIFKMDNLLDFFPLTKSKPKVIGCGVCFPGFIKDFFDFMFIKKQILNEIEKSFSCQFCDAKFVVEKLLTDQLHSSMLTNN